MPESCLPLLYPYKCALQKSLLSQQRSTLHSGTKINILSKERTQDQHHRWGASDKVYSLGKMDDGNELCLGRNVLRYPWVWEVWTRYLTWMWSFLSVNIRKHLSYRRPNHNGHILSQQAAVLNHYGGLRFLWETQPRGKICMDTILQITLRSSQVPSPPYGELCSMWWS